MLSRAGEPGAGVIYRSSGVIALLEPPHETLERSGHPSVLVVPTVHAPSLLKLPPRSTVQFVFAAVAVGQALRTIFQLEQHEVPDHAADELVVLQETCAGLPDDPHYVARITRYLNGGVHATWMMDSVQPSDEVIAPIVLQLRRHLDARRTGDLC